MTEIRCKKCNRLLMKAERSWKVEIKCPKCGYLNHLEYALVTEVVGKWSNGMPEKRATGEIVVTVF